MEYTSFSLLLFSRHIILFFCFSPFGTLFALPISFFFFLFLGLSIVSLLVRYKRTIFIGNISYLYCVTVEVLLLHSEHIVKCSSHGEHALPAPFHIFVVYLSEASFHSDAICLRDFLSCSQLRLVHDSSKYVLVMILC